jgi:hypothetical protein
MLNEDEMTMPTEQPLTEDEIRRRRDEALRRALSTPPQPKHGKVKESNPPKTGRVHGAKPGKRGQACGWCTRRRQNPSVKRPDCSVVPE